MVNAVGFLVPNSFEGDIHYLTLRLLDTPSEDMLSVFYDVFDFIEDARARGGKVYVHCSQGVSRSAALVIAYLMWKTGRNYEEVFQSVKDVRGVVNPNIGFICQLLQWQKRRAQIMAAHGKGTNPAASSGTRPIPTPTAGKGPAGAPALPLAPAPEGPTSSASPSTSATPRESSDGMQADEPPAPAPLPAAASPVARPRPPLPPGALAALGPPPGLSLPAHLRPPPPPPEAAPVSAPVGLKLPFPSPPQAPRNAARSSPGPSAAEAAPLALRLPAAPPGGQPVGKGPGKGTDPLSVREPLPTARSSSDGSGSELSAPLAPPAPLAAPALRLSLGGEAARSSHPAGAAPLPLVPPPVLRFTMGRAPLPSGAPLLASVTPRGAHRGSSTTTTTTTTSSPSPSLDGSPAGRSRAAAPVPAGADMAGEGDGSGSGSGPSTARTSSSGGSDPSSSNPSTARTSSTDEDDPMDGGEGARVQAPPPAAAPRPPAASAPTPVGGPPRLPPRFTLPLRLPADPHARSTSPRPPPPPAPTTTPSQLGGDSFIFAAAREGSIVGPTGLRVYRLAPHSSNDPSYIVPKSVAQAPPLGLDPRFSFVLHAPAALVIWHGAESPPAFRAAAHRCCGHLQKYEFAPSLDAEFEQGAEPADAWADLTDLGFLRKGPSGPTPLALSSSDSESEPTPSSSEPASDASPAKPPPAALPRPPSNASASAPAPAPAPVHVNASYTYDWDVWLGKIKPQYPGVPAVLPTAPPLSRRVQWTQGEAPPGEDEASGWFTPRFRRTDSDKSPATFKSSVADEDEEMDDECPPAPRGASTVSPGVETTRAFKKSRSEMTRGSPRTLR